jgi:hypothetical protein
MKFWVKFLRIIYRLIALPWLRKAQAKSIESVLLKSMDLLEPEMLNEIASFIRTKQTKQGGFADKAGNCDLYYSLFGYYIAETLSLHEMNEPLKRYVKKTVSDNALAGVHLYCASILYVKLHGLDRVSENLRKQVVQDLTQTKNQLSGYTNFLGILALYYFGDFLGIKKILNKYKSSKLSDTSPCPVTAATAILLEIAGKPDPSAEHKLKSYYRENGGFAALKQTPAEDLLSTAVALYALNFMDADIRLIKPDCLTFITDLYHEGGFCSMQLDVDTDVEYTFYGLLALGALNMK